MTKNSNTQPLDDSAYETLVAEEELILHAQMLIQRALNDRNLSQKDLAGKLGVGESYVSQMLGLSARTLTLRTIARVMSALDAKATLVLDDEVEGVATANAVEDGAEAVASRMASARLSQVWGEVIALPSRKKAKRRQDGDAHAYSAFDPPVREVAMAA